MRRRALRVPHAEQRTYIVRANQLVMNALPPRIPIRTAAFSRNSFKLYDLHSGTYDLTAFIPGLKRPVKHRIGISSSQFILDVCIRLASALRMQCRLVTSTIARLILIEVSAARCNVSAPLSRSSCHQFSRSVSRSSAPAAFITSRSLVGLISFVSISNDDRMAVSQRIFVKIDVFVWYAFTELFFDRIANG